MNPTRLILSIVAVFIGIFATDFLIHGFWLAADYKATASLWRSDAEMTAHFPWLLLGQFVCAAIFTLIWAKAFANWGCLRCAAIYGSMMGLFFQASSFITHAVSPLPSDIMAKWVVSGIVQMTVMGLLLFFVYKPAAPMKPIT
jgi:hypothetical protein